MWLSPYSMIHFLKYLGGVAELIEILHRENNRIQQPSLKLKCIITSAQGHVEYLAVGLINYPLNNVQFSDNKIIKVAPKGFSLYQCLHNKINLFILHSHTYMQVFSHLTVLQVWKVNGTASWSLRHQEAVPMTFLSLVQILCHWTTEVHVTNAFNALVLSVISW